MVAPLPLAVTPEPTKLRVVPKVESAEPSSCTVMPEPPPGIVTVLFAPLPEAVTPAPTKSILVVAVDKSEPSSAMVSDPPPPPELAVVCVVPSEKVIPFAVTVSVPLETDGDALAKKAVDALVAAVPRPKVPLMVATSASSISALPAAERLVVAKASLPVA